MAGTGSKTTSGTITPTTLYGWEKYSPDAYIVQGKTGQTAIYGSPYWYEKLYGAGNQTIYLGGFYATSEYSTSRTGSGAITVAKYMADYVNGGTGSNWLSFLNFSNLAVAKPDRAKSDPTTAWNSYEDLGGAERDVTASHYLQTSLISGSGHADYLYGTAGVVVNLSSKSLYSTLQPLIRQNNQDGTIKSYGLVSGLSDYITARLTNSDANNGLTTATTNDLYAQSGGLGAGQYAFFTKDGTATYAVGQVVNIQNVQGSSQASNVIVGGVANGILQGGAKADVIVGGTGNSSLYGMGGNDLLVATVGNDTLYAGQYGHLGTAPKAAVVVDKTLLDLFKSGSPEDKARLGEITATTMVGGTGVVNMVGSDAGHDYFLVGSANETIYGSGLGASGLGAEGSAWNVADQDTLSFAQIGTAYYKDYKNLTITITYSDSFHQSGSAAATYMKADGSIATLFNDKFFDIEHIVFGSAMMVFKDPANPNGYYPTDPIDPGFTGGDPAQYNNTSGLIDAGPATSTITGNNPNGGNVFNGGGGGNTNYNGGAGGNNTVNFNSTSPGGTYYDCEDTLGGTGNVRNYSLVLDLLNGRYTYQQDVNGAATVYGGAISNIQSVNGTADCSDIMVGRSDSIYLAGGGGTHNIVYAGGGIFTDAEGNTHATKLQGSWLTGSANYTTNGGAASNWVVFQNPTDLINGGVVAGAGGNSGGGRDGSAYAGGVNANLDPEYTFTVDTKTYTGEMIGFANILGTSGDDTLTGDVNDNILVGGGGNDTISGGATGEWGGDDTLYGGAGYNRITGGALSGKVSTFVVGYNYNPVAAGAYANDGTYGPVNPDADSAANTTGDIFVRDINDAVTGTLADVGIVTTTKGTDVITDWKTSDKMYVSRQGTAVIEGLNTSEDGTSAHTSLKLSDETEGATYTIDFRGTQNLGEIKVDGSDADGNNTVHGSSGIDRIFLGNGSNVVNDTLAIDDWNRAAEEHQTIVVGNGNNTINVENGAYDIYAGSGINRINLGSADRQDNVYIYSYATRDWIENFQSGTDKLYFDVNLLKAMGLGSAINPDGTMVASSRANAGALGGDTIMGESNGGWQDYDTGNIGILSGLYDAVYQGALNSIGADNGAWSNNQFQAAYVAAVAANSAVITADFILANALSAIPIVGPFLAIPFFVLGGLMIYDTIGTDSYFNAVYNTGRQDGADNPLSGLANTLLVDNTSIDTSSGNWTATQFLDFYNHSSSDGFTPSLEFVDSVNTSLYPLWYHNPNDSIGVEDGVHTIALLYSGGYTYVYVVNSSDELVQDNEARLMAKVEGHITADDIALFDSSKDANLNGLSIAPPELPPSFVTLGFTVDGSKVSEVDSTSKVVYHTNATSGTLTFTFAATLSGDTLTLKDSKGNTVGTKTSVEGNAVSFDVTDLNAGANAYSLTVTTSSGFESRTSVLLDVTAPPTNTADHTDVQLSATSLGINVSSRVAASFVVQDDSAIPQVISLDTDPSSAVSGWIPAEQGKNVTLIPTAQATKAVWIESLLFKDALGDTSTITLGVQPHQASGTAENPVYDTLPYIGLGTLGNDQFDASLSGKNYNDATTVIYGFGGNDSVKANESTTLSTLFIAGDDGTVGGTNGVLNQINADAKGGNLIIDFTGSKNSVDTLEVKDGAAARHLDRTIALSVVGFDVGEDKLVFTDDVSTSLWSPASGSSLTVVDGKISFTGIAPTTLAGLITAVETELSGATQGSVAAVQYQYFTTVDVYNTDPTSVNYGKATSTEVSHDDLVVFHVEAGGTYSVVQLTGVGAETLSLSAAGAVMLA